MTNALLSTLVSTLAVSIRQMAGSCDGDTAHALRREPEPLAVGPCNFFVIPTQEDTQGLHTLLIQL
jgi:hypothetical protein